VIAAIAAVGLILFAGVYSLFHKPQPPVLNAKSAPDARAKMADAEAENPAEPNATPQHPVLLEANVPGTRFSEAGQTLDPSSLLTIGSHTIEASHEGYLSESKTLNVEKSANGPLNVKFELRAILPQLRFSSSIARGRLVIDDAESLDLQAGVASKEDLALGQHTVKIYEGNRQVFSFTFETKPNERPVLLAPLANESMAGVVVASLAGAAKVYTTATLRASARLPVAPVPEAGIDINGSPNNPAHFFLDAGRGRGPQQQSVDPSVLPTLTVQLAGASQPLYVDITSTVPDCRISVDGKPLNRPMNGQSISIAMEPGNHPVRLSCPGYQELEQVASVKAEEATPNKLAFSMVAIPAPVAAVRRAVFTLIGAPPETLVFQNQMRIGTVGPDGSFSREIDPGTYTFEWRKAGFDPRKETRTVRAGELLKLEGVLTASTGSLILKVAPEGARLAIHRDSDGSSINVASNVPIALAPGPYRITASAPEYAEASESVVVASGKALSVNLNLERTPTVVGPSGFFEDGDSWKPSPEADGWWVHSGSGYSALRSSTGAFTIDFLKKKHFHKINLLADCSDHTNCIVYAIDAHNFSTKLTVNGATLLDKKVPHGMDSNSSFHLVFEMSPDAIVVKNRAGAVLSTVERKNPRGKLLVQDDNPLVIN
jgi:hypothetical protein